MKSWDVLVQGSVVGGAVWMCRVGGNGGAVGLVDNWVGKGL